MFAPAEALERQLLLPPVPTPVPMVMVTVLVAHRMATLQMNLAAAMEALIQMALLLTRTLQTLELPGMAQI